MTLCMSIPYPFRARRSFRRCSFNACDWSSRTNVFFFSVEPVDRSNSTCYHNHSINPYPCITKILIWSITQNSRDDSLIVNLSVQGLSLINMILRLFIVPVTSKHLLRATLDFLFSELLFNHSITLYILTTVQYKSYNRSENGSTL